MIRRIQLISLLVFTFAKSNAQVWDSVGTGITGTVQSLVADTIHNKLYIGGTYYGAGNISPWSVAGYDADLKSYFYVSNMNDFIGATINALYLRHDSLFAAGFFPSSFSDDLAVWNGTIWTSFNGGLCGNSNWIYTIEEFIGNIYVGGEFRFVHGPTVLDSVNYITYWNGNDFLPLGTSYGINAGVCGLCSPTQTPAITKIFVFNNELFIGGRFNSVGAAIPANYIARWNGISWSAAGTVNVTPYAFAVYNNELYMGGNGYDIYKWTGSNWNVFATTSGGWGVSAMEIYNGDLYVGGGFDTINGVHANSIARWNGTAWSELTSGVTINGGQASGNVNALVSLDGSLYVGGVFDHAGGIPANNLARWGPLLSANEENKNPLEHVSVYPNPAKNKLYLTTANIKTCTLNIYDCTSQKIFSQTINTTQTTIDISFLAPGIYIYECLDKNGFAKRGKIVKQ